MKIYIPVRTRSGAENFRKRHAFMQDSLVFLDNISSSFVALNELVANVPEPFLFMHEDSYADGGFLVRAQDALDMLGDSNWGAAGNAGVGCNLYGLTASPMVKYFIDAAGGPNLPGRIIPAQMTAGPVLLVNAPLLRKKNVLLPHFNGHDFIDLILGLKCVQAGLACWIVPQLLCYLQTDLAKRNREWEEKGSALLEYIAAETANTSIETFYGRKDVPLPHGKTDWSMEAIQNSAMGNFNVAIVVRTQFKRQELLFRTLQTIRTFIAAASSDNVYCINIIADTAKIPDDIPEDIKVIIRKAPEGVEDTRLFLVREAIASIDADYLWFIDDDDWLFPNRADFITQSILASPPGSTFYLGARLFHESEVNEGNCWEGNSRTAGGIYYDPKEYIRSNSGANAIPFCGIIFPAENLKAILKENNLEHVSYGEDYCLELLNMYHKNFFPIIIGVMAAGISIRESGNTVTEKDRTKWNISSSAIMANTVCKSSMLINLPSYLQRYPPLDKNDIIRELRYKELKYLLKRKFINKGKYILSRTLGKILPERFRK